ncbi:hypothetical protein ODZ84_03215 [Chryseobacterium fluminis]|uniref:hypothetical protein n=1 Tax=Chryseobacterium fluminis TaxID=2983606 RepID=UPI00224D3E3C|nr:hypothetical protein [Chryseobacterium sp. MMS21-Ot14]UZT98597.1 hypothetical protein ODZ84_03215 [Chryseobacterium sp. MMS21-Ot14]
MKSIFKTTLIASILIICSSKAQTTTDYINFYNTVVPKLKSITPGKTQFYGQPFSIFYNELQNRNINLVGLVYDTKIKPSTKYHVVSLFFCDATMISIASKNSFRYPIINITFEDEIPSHIISAIEQNNSRWNTSLIQLFSNLKIENIKFIGINGYESSDRTIK